jgi:UDP-N-acetylmuramoylalanine--D-glutamate ligase
MGSLATETKGRPVFFHSDSGDDCAFRKGDALILRWKKEERVLCREGELSCRTNPENIMAAALAGRILGVGPDEISEAICAFPGVEQRLEWVREIDGVNYYNDSSSTTPESSINALASFPRGSVILLAGGSGKGISFQVLGERILERRARVVLYGETRHEIQEAIRDAERHIGGSVTVEICAGFDEAVETAARIAAPSDNVVFSPACASFDLFSNSKERGRRFKSRVEALGGGGP